MRKLTSIELSQINDRLETIRIQYQEIYDEIKDHYLSELEKKSSADFKATLTQLNEAFSYSVVRKMEKNLRRSTKKLIAQMQWNKLKFWSLNNQSPLYFIVTMTILALVYYYLDVEGMALMVVVFSLIGIPSIWYSIGSEVSFSLKRFSIRSSRVFANEILNRSGIFYGGLSFFYISYENWNSSNPGVPGAILTWILITTLLLYMLTLLQVTLDWKQKQHRVIPQ